MSANVSGDFDLVDPEAVSFSFPCLRARQPIGDMFVAVIPFKRLEQISFFDVRRVLFTDRDFERYLGIQRPVDDKRREALMKYVNFVDASFPTSIVIALNQDYVQYDDLKHEMTVSNCRPGEKKPSAAISHLAKVLDGQHRIAGLEGFRGTEFELSVTIFIGADVADQAQIFATVNLEQTKVNKSLVYDLYELSKSRSPQKTCHNITVALDRDPKSPLFKRIKRLGVATEGREFEMITQATMVDGIIKYISNDPQGDRDMLLRGKRLVHFEGEDLKRYPLRNLFVDDKDLDITRIFYNYFTAIENRWPRGWRSREPGFMLNRTNGVRALLRFFRYAYEKAVKPGGIPTVDQLNTRVFSLIKIDDEQFTTENFLPGTSGESRLLNVLRGADAL